MSLDLVGTGRASGHKNSACINYPTRGMYFLSTPNPLLTRTWCKVLKDVWGGKIKGNQLNHVHLD